MATGNFDIIPKATSLMEYTIRITSNRKRYPVKYIQHIKRIQNISMDVYEFILDANRLNLSISKRERIELQTKAITSCDKLSCFIEISLNLNLVGTDAVAFWQKQIDDVKYMTIAWREKDKKR